LRSAQREHCERRTSNADFDFDFDFDLDFDFDFDFFLDTLQK